MVGMQSGTRPMETLFCNTAIFDNILISCICIYPLTQKLHFYITKKIHWWKKGNKYKSTNSQSYPLYTNYI